MSRHGQVNFSVRLDAHELWLRAVPARDEVIQSDYDDEDGSAEHQMVSESPSLQGRWAHIGNRVVRQKLCRAHRENKTHAAGQFRQNTASWACRPGAALEFCDTTPNRRMTGTVTYPLR